MFRFGFRPSSSSLLVGMSRLSLTAAAVTNFPPALSSSATLMRLASCSSSSVIASSASVHSPLTSCRRNKSTTATKQRRNGGENDSEEDGTAAALNGSQTGLRTLSFASIPLEADGKAIVDGHTSNPVDKTILTFNALRKLHMAERQCDRRRQHIEVQAWRTIQSIPPSDIEKASDYGMTLVVCAWAYFARFWENGRRGPLPPMPSQQSSSEPGGAKGTSSSKGAGHSSNNNDTETIDAIFVAKSTLSAGALLDHIAALQNYYREDQTLINARLNECFPPEKDVKVVIDHLAAQIHESDFSGQGSNETSGGAEDDEDEDVASLRSAEDEEVVGDSFQAGKGSDAEDADIDLAVDGTLKPKSATTNAPSNSTIKPSSQQKRGPNSSGGGNRPPRSRDHVGGGGGGRFSNRNSGGSAPPKKNTTEALEAPRAEVLDEVFE